jgi:sec-independent protein translocase protein TatB
MASIGMWDTLILMVLALVVFGPRRLPQIARQIGKLMYEFRKASNDFKFQMELEMRDVEEADRRKKEVEERQRLAAALPQPQIERTVSPAPQSNAPAPEAKATTAAAPEDPYRDLYPSASTPLSDPAPTAEKPQAEDTAVPAPEPGIPRDVPRIQPPSTGETVAAERPTWQPRQQELFAAGPGEAPESVSSGTVTAGHEAERSEPAAHHG